MAHRQEEKEQRRLERLKQEEAEKRAAARRKRLQLVLGGVLGLALLAAVAVGIASGLGGDGGDDDPQAARTPDATVELPPVEVTDFEQAAETAGCDLEHPPNEGAAHEEREFTADDYDTNPPTSGTHFPTWYDDGIYEPGEVPELGQLVHTLEHGRINVQYAPGTPPETVDQLEAFLAEKTGYHALLYENTTDMPYEVAATAWGHLLGCPEMNPQVFDALRTFYDRYVDKGPEQVP